MTQIPVNAAGPANFQKDRGYKMNILVTAIGSLAADIVIKTLRKNHHGVIGCDIFPREWIVDAYNVDEFIQAPPAKAKDEYVSFIKRVCQQFDVKFIMPLTDPEVDVMGEFKNELGAQGVCACVSDHEVIKLCRDKFLLPQYLGQQNICTAIPTYWLGEVDQIRGFPLLAKPRFGRSSQGIMEVRSEAEYGYVKEVARDGEYVIQPFIKGNFLTIDVIRNPDDTVVCIARRELLRNPSGAGTTVEIIENPALTEICSKIARSLGIIGAVNFEFIETRDKLYFLEANPRFSGGVEFSHMAGYDVVSNHLKCFTNQLIDTKIKIKRMIIARKYQEYVTEVL